MTHNLSYTLFIKHFIKKKLELNYSLYIDEKTKQILDFTESNNETSYINVYKKVIKIEKTNAVNPTYSNTIWEKLTESPIMKTMLFYYTSLVEYHYFTDIYYEEYHSDLTNRLFIKNPFQHLGNTYDAIKIEFIEIIIKTENPYSIDKNEIRKSYTCISKYYPHFFEYIYNIKKNQRTPINEKIHKAEKETIEYILSWMQ